MKILNLRSFPVLPGSSHIYINIYIYFWSNFCGSKQFSSVTKCVGLGHKHNVLNNINICFQGFHLFRITIKKWKICFSLFFSNCLIPMFVFELSGNVFFIFCFEVLKKQILPAEVWKPLRTARGQFGKRFV